MSHHYIAQSIVPVQGFRAIYSENDGSFTESPIVALAVADLYEICPDGETRVTDPFHRSVVGMSVVETEVEVVNNHSNFLCLLGPLEVFDVENRCAECPGLKVHSPSNLNNPSGEQPR